LVDSVCPRIGFTSPACGGGRCARRARRVGEALSIRRLHLRRQPSPASGRGSTPSPCLQLNLISSCSLRAVIPAHARCRVRRGRWILSLTPRITRSPAEACHWARRGRDPVAGDDGWMWLRNLAARCARVVNERFAQREQRAWGMPGARCSRSPCALVGSTR
jgi:hypothetical protein